jgi:hypothetical protein
MSFNSAFQRNAFQKNAFQIVSGDTILQRKAAGPAFTRKRYDDLQAQLAKIRKQEEAKRAAEKQRREDEKQAALAALIDGWATERKAQTAAANDLLARLVEDHRLAGAHSAALTQDMLMRSGMQALHAAHVKAQQDAEDEEAALVALMDD